ncbi:CDP-diacylglycerol--glycerol-3-phosphate 3-phosphatidyltransferase [Candidatus Saccharibacteria bacterium]|nr:CDP-diacylglycerol--glycerol-3-phosphate 3-phosphatidyltransferase [Candidatus Saccharibacteria bacterium]
MKRGVKARGIADSRPSATDEERYERSAVRNGGPARASREAAILAPLTGPTYLTIFRMVLSVVFMVFALVPDLWAQIVALVVFVAAAITDKIDGIWARKSGHVTDLGAFLDPLADKMLVDLAFLVLVYIDVVPIWVFAIVLVRDLAVDGMRMMAAREKVTIAASFLGKLKTTVQMTALITLLANQVLQNGVIAVLGQIALYLALALTIISGADYLYHGCRKYIKK